MSDPIRDPGADRDPVARRLARVPRWVKVFVVIAAVLAVALVLVMLFGGGSHGPGRHLSLGGAGAGPPAAGPSAAMSALGPWK